MNMAEVTKKLADLKQTQSYEKTFDFNGKYVCYSHYQRGPVP